MTEQGTTFDLASREESGSVPFGRYFEEFEVGAVYKHVPGKTITDSEDHLFCLLTMNHHPLHLDDRYAAESQQGRNVVVGSYVYSLALGMSVRDVSGKAIANLATDGLKHTKPVFHGDTLYTESEVLEKTPSATKDDRGVVAVRTDVYNQHNELVTTFNRKVLVPRKS
jgi:acyl dehydratase